MTIESDYAELSVQIREYLQAMEERKGRAPSKLYLTSKQISILSKHAKLLNTKFNDSYLGIPIEKCDIHKRPRRRRPKECML